MKQPRLVISLKGLERALMGVELLLDADHQRACDASVAASYQPCNSMSEDFSHGNSVQSINFADSQSHSAKALALLS